MGDVWKALADPTRRKILEMLRKNSMSAGDISDCFDMSKPSISNHLSILRNAGLIDAEKKGQSIIYSIDTSVFEDILSTISDFAKREEDK